MAEGKKSFILYSDIQHTVKKLTDEKAGQLFKHLLAYVNDEHPTTDDIVIEIAFEPIKQSLKRDLVKYEEIREKKRLAGIASAESKKQQKQQQSTPVDTCQQDATDSTVNDNDSVSDINIKKELCPYQDIFDLYNSICKSLAKIQSLTDSRKKKIKTRWIEIGSIEKIKQLFTKAESTPFLKGDNKQGWKADFDWMFENDTNWIKIIEGAYDSKKPAINGQDQNPQRAIGFKLKESIKN